MALFRTLADAKKFGDLIAFCRERSRLAADADTLLRWRKDESIAEAMRGNFRAAYELLKNSDWLAARVEGAMRAKYENEFGLVLIEYGRPVLGLERLRLGREYARAAERPDFCAFIEHNIGRAYAAFGESVKAREHLNAALEFARRHDDYRLQMEVCQTFVEFGVK